MEKTSKTSVREHFDHPVVFTFLIAMVVLAWIALFTWAAKAHGWTGAASLAQHP